MIGKKLPVGIDIFEQLRKEDFYYVDKTGLISDIMRNWGSVNLFTRPRRFGKTLNMSMLKCFFEIGGDTATIEKYLNDQLVSTISYYDSRESFYHGFLAALLNTCAQWGVSSNDESGNGRPDITVEREDGKVGFVIEVKCVRDYEKLDTACETAMKQIEEKDYTAVLRRYRVKEIWQYAIAFWEKECRVVAKNLSVEYGDR